MEDPDEVEYIAPEDMDIVEEDDIPDTADTDEDVDVESPENPVPSRDDAVAVLTGHKESVFCLTVDPLGNYVVSGGQDHVAIVWDLETHTQVFVTEGHEDSVTCVSFTSDGAYLATGDMAGGIRVWLRPQEDCKSWNLLHSDNVGDLLWLCWWQPSRAIPGHSSPAVLASGDADGLVTIRSIAATNPKGTAKHIKYIAGSGVPATAAVFFLPFIHTDRPKLVTLYQNAELKLWDLKSEESLTTIQLEVEDTSASGSEPSSTVFCLACPKDKPLYTQLRDRELVAVGGVGMIHFTVIRQNEAVDSSFTAKCVSRVETGDAGSVEALDFAWTHPFLAFGTVEGTIGIVDTTKFRVRQKWTYTDQLADSVSITCLRWSRSHPIFFTSTSNGEVLAWPGLTGGTETDVSGFMKSPSPLATWQGHRSMVLDFSLSCSLHSSSNLEQFVISASDDATVRIFAIAPDLSSR